MDTNPYKSPESRPDPKPPTPQPDNSAMRADLSDFLKSKSKPARELELLCNEFQIGTLGVKSWAGRVLVDVDAIYMLPQISGAMAMAGVLGGAIGGAIAYGISKISDRPLLPFETTFYDLSADVRKHPKWGKMNADARVIAVPKASVEKLSVSIWTGCTVTTAECKFILKIPFYRVRRGREILQRFGWMR